MENGRIFPYSQRSGQPVPGFCADIFKEVVLCFRLVPDAAVAFFLLRASLPVTPFRKDAGWYGCMAPAFSFMPDCLRCGRGQFHPVSLLHGLPGLAGGMFLCLSRFRSGFSLLHVLSLLKTKQRVSPPERVRYSAFSSQDTVCVGIKQQYAR